MMTNRRNVFSALIILCISVLFLMFQNCSLKKIMAFEDDTKAPSIISATTEKNEGGQNLIKIQLKATDDYTGIAGYCIIKTSEFEPTPNQPGINDPCWVNLEAPHSKTFEKDIEYFLGFIPQKYRLHFFVKDSNQNISSSSSNDNLGFAQTTTYKLNRIIPPVLLNVIAANTDITAPSYDRSLFTTQLNDSIYIKWKDSSSDYLSNRVSIFVSTDNTTWTKVIENLKNQSNGSCTLSQQFNGCYVYTNASNSKNLQIRVEIINEARVKTSSVFLMNSGAFRSIAGNTESGIGSSATSALFESKYSSLAPDRRLFVVSSATGEVYFRSQLGLLKTEKNTGNLEILIPSTGSIKDGDVQQSTIRNITAIYLKHDNSVVFYDENRLRVFNPKDNTVSTLIGGGNSKLDGVDALSFQFSSPIDFTFLPNGNIIFTEMATFNHEDSFIYTYISETKKVFKRKISGNAAYGRNNFNFTTPSQTYPFYYNYGLGISYNKETSEITKTALRINICPGVGCGHQPTISLLDSNAKALDFAQQNLPQVSTFFSEYAGFVSSLNGQLYYLTKNYSNNSDLAFFDESSRSWKKIFNGQLGFCEDGELASNCKSNLEDAFINQYSDIYIFDNGMIRVIGKDSKIYTIFGQKRSFGDGLNARNARFNSVNSLGLNNNNELILLDSRERKIRKVNLNNYLITTVAGNSNSEFIQNSASSMNTGFTDGYWGADYRMVVSPTSGDIFYSEEKKLAVLKSNEQYSTWHITIPGQTTYYDAPEGAAFSNINPHYPPILSGIYNDTAILSFSYWDGNYHQNGMLKRLNTTSMAVSHLAGAKNTSYTVDCFICDNSLGKSVYETSIYAPSFSNRSGTLKYLPDLDVWISWNNDRTKLVSIKPNQTVENFATLPTSIENFTISKNELSQYIVYYCSSSDSKIYKKNISTGIVNKLDLPNHYSCKGNDMLYKQDTKSIIFIYKSNGVDGVGEIFD